ncbi:MAG: PGF-pre-PGF domain-containing protein [Halobacteria archaeon]
MVVDNNGTIWVSFRSERTTNSTIWISRSNVTVTFPNNTTTTWTSNSNITFTSFSADPANDTYNISYSADNGATWTPIVGGILPNNSVEFNGSRSWNSSNLSDGNYKLRVCRVRANGFSQCNQTGNITLDNAPASTTNLAATVTASALNWTWTNPTDADFSHVEVWIDGLFAGNRSNATFENASLACGTSRTISLRATDNKNHLNSTWVNLTSTTTACHAPPAPVAGSGGGGGGCCAAAPVEAAPGAPVAFDLPPGAPVGRVEAVPETPGPVQLSARPLAAPPAGAPPPPGPVARLMEISLKSLAGDPVKVKSAAMEFKVERTWMAQNAVPEERVALLRLEGDHWAAYPAKKVGDSPAEVKFKAETPGLSVFAVGAGPAPSPTPTPPPPSPSPAKTPAVISGPPSPTPGNDGTHVPPVPTPRSPGFEVGVAVGALAGLAAMAMVRRRRF